MSQIMVVQVEVTLISIQKHLESLSMMPIVHFIHGKSVFNVLESLACLNLKASSPNIDIENKNVVSVFNNFERLALTTYLS